MVHWWHFPIFVGFLLLPYAGEFLVRRAKRGSTRWHQRSVRQQRMLARLPGIGVALVAAAVITALNVQW